MVEVIRTKRLILRTWEKEDLEPFARLNADPRVMEHYPAPLSKEESDAFAGRIITAMEFQQWGLWAVSVPGVSHFIGYIGLAPVNFQLNPKSVPFSDSFVPQVEIGWRLAYEYWGQGFATEGAKACLEYAYKCLGLDEIISFTATQNKRSMNVMQKIGMKHCPERDFDHPRIVEGHPLRRHVFYRILLSDQNRVVLGM